jgi:hypothetical protein
MKMKLAYVSGKYRDKRGPWYILQNIRAAETVALELWRMGFAVICPHKNTALFDGAVPSDQVWLDGDLEMVRRSDLIVMIPEADDSEGARIEMREAIKHDISVYRWPRDIELLRELATEPETRWQEPAPDPV